MNQNENNEIEKLAKELSDLKDTPTDYLGSYFPYKIRDIAEFIIKQGYRKTQPESIGLDETPNDIVFQKGFAAGVKSVGHTKQDLEPLDESIVFEFLLNKRKLSCKEVTMQELDEIQYYAQSLCSKFGHKKTDIKVPSEEKIRELIFKLAYEYSNGMVRCNVDPKRIDIIHAAIGDFIDTKEVDKAIHRLISDLGE